MDWAGLAVEQAAENEPCLHDDDVVAQALSGLDVSTPRIGKGGNKVAYLGHLDGEAVVVKYVRQPVSSSGDETEQAIAVPERFRREIAAMMTIESPHVARVLLEPFVGQFGSCTHLCYVEQHYSGGDLNSRLGVPWEPAEVRRLMLDLLSGVEALSERSIVHRDIKPENIVIDSVGRFVLIDLGIALFHGLSTLTDVQVLGPRTNMFAAPELLSPRSTAQVDTRTDFFQMGIVGFMALTAQHPFFPPDDGFFGRLLSGKLAEGVLDPFDPALSVVLRRLLKPSPGQRYRTTAMLRKALEDCA